MKLSITNTEFSWVFTKFSNFQAIRTFCHVHKWIQSAILNMIMYITASLDQQVA
jgi:hypothetical protein